jgi:hypothetical protein
VELVRLSNPRKEARSTTTIRTAERTTTTTTTTIATTTTTTKRVGVEIAGRRAAIAMLTRRLPLATATRFLITKLLIFFRLEDVVAFHSVLGRAGGRELYLHVGGNKYLFDWTPKGPKFSQIGQLVFLGKPPRPFRRNWCRLFRRRGDAAE